MSGTATLLPTHGLRWLYVGSTLTEGAVIEGAAQLEGLTERHKVELQAPPLSTIGSVPSTASETGVDGVVFELQRGWPGRTQLVDAAKLLRAGKQVLLHWPREGAVEVVDRERLVGHGAVWVAAAAWRAKHREKLVPPPQNDLQMLTATETEVESGMRAQARELLAEPRPLPIRISGGKVQGPGAYLRTDYWAPIVTGGSYGHTCYVAAELARRSDGFFAFMANRFGLLDELGVRQIGMTSVARDQTEESILAATPGHLVQLRPALEVLQPAYLYERLVLGNLTGARVSRELGIPYVIEYNGSEVSMKRSFAGEDYEHAELFELIELAAFSQASVISVISDVVADSLVARGVDPAKILVNPNGADASAYAPPTGDERAAVRSELGFTDETQVVGFIGTFGGWHGIDVLAEALPELCRRYPRARFLLIGDGHQRPLVDEAVRDHALWGRVVMTGRVSHAEGARLLKACDLFVSPHSSNMVDSPFFGSPTKLFEYMALGRGIVASDLQQIGEVLSPALRPEDFAGEAAPAAAGKRAVLCKPGVVSDFVAGVAALLDHPEVSDALGVNARAALLAEFTWERHVERLLAFAETGEGRTPMLPREEPAQEEPAPQLARTGSRLTLVSTGDAYKDETQRQWNDDACGSHYVEGVEEHTLEWYLEVERYRYQEYGPWMPETMEFAGHRDRDVLEIGAGIGTDLAQFASHGARVTDYDLSAGHLALAQENFRLRGLDGRFVHGDAETLPFEDASFDLVYSNGVIHHTPNTQQVVDEIFRVLRPGGRAIIMVYSESSLHYWRNLVRDLGLRDGLLEEVSVGEIMSRHVEISENDQRPLVKAYTKRRLRQMFSSFAEVDVVRRQMVPAELPSRLRRVPVDKVGKLAGWNLVVKARKPAGS